MTILEQAIFIKGYLSCVLDDSKIDFEQLRYVYSYLLDIDDELEKEELEAKRKVLNDAADDEYDEGSDYEMSYDEYGGAYGYDDDTIDYAFDGDPENFWNID